jgi:hypothetical protein
VDLAPFYREGAAIPAKRFFWREGWLVSVAPKTVAKWREQMGRPEWAIRLVPSAAHLRILLDKDGALAALVDEARSFRWEPLQPAADAFCSEMLMLAGEYALKLHSALVRDDQTALPYPLGEILRMLSWIAATHYGVMIETGTSYLQQVQQAAGTESGWSRTYQMALGMRAEPMRERATAALLLYRETARMLALVLMREHREVVTGVVEQIERDGCA